VQQAEHVACARVRAYLQSVLAAAAAAAAAGRGPRGGAARALSVSLHHAQSGGGGNEREGENRLGPAQQILVKQQGPQVLCYSGLVHS
jgi:hypothetical protein